MPATPAWPPRSAPRLFVPGPLAEGQAVPLDGPQAHYLLKVMRAVEGDAVILCDDMTGEWAARVTSTGKRDIVLTPDAHLREREQVPDFTLCAALLKKPDLLILDEPTNGLDPAGIRDIRRMIRDLGRSGVTVLLSSHLLAEVQQVCDSVSIIGEGRLLSSGRVDELVGREPGQAVRVGLADPAAAVPHLEAAGWRVERSADGLTVVGAQDAADISRVLGEQGLWVRELAPEHADLESVFLRLTDKDRSHGGRDEREQGR